MKKLLLISLTLVGVSISFLNFKHFNTDINLNIDLSTNTYYMVDSTNNKKVPTYSSKDSYKNNDITKSAKIVSNDRTPETFLSL